jgi:ATP phosphoribosyltransferase
LRIYVAVASASAQNADGICDLSSIGRTMSMRMRFSRLSHWIMDYSQSLICVE